MKRESLALVEVSPQPEFRCMIRSRVYPLVIFSQDSWRVYRLHNCSKLQCWDRQVLLRFSHFWAIRVLRLTHHIRHPYLDALQLLKGTLEHLEVITFAADLHWCTGATL